MNKLCQYYVWLKRLRYSRGFGIQSPTDYQYVRYVINEHWPYYAFTEIGHTYDSLKRKLGQLYFRVANARQPNVIVDWLGYDDYLMAACPNAQIVRSAAKVELAFLPLNIDYNRLFDLCDEHSVVVFQDIWRNQPLWHCIEYDERVSVTFDLYYCGIVFFDRKRSPHNYVVNF